MTGGARVRLSAQVFALVVLAAAAVTSAHQAAGSGRLWTVGGLVLVWALAWFVNSRLSTLMDGGWRTPLVAAVFGLTLLFIWEVACVGFGVPTVLLPPPSLILARLSGSLPILAGDFAQTVLRAVLPGWAIGCGCGFLLALLCDRFDFLRRGLIPIGNLASALPIIGVAPIFVMWFGFDWQSKAAVVVVLTLFPMLVNTVAGLSASGPLERDLMRSYGASWGRTLLALRLPAAMPFIFNALKLNAALALIGAIVAEFFGTPMTGLGFRISTEVGRMALDMVWAAIVVAALSGSALYGMLAYAERRITFWHPSIRRA